MTDCAISWAARGTPIALAVMFAATVASPCRAQPASVSASATADDNARARSSFRTGIDALRAGRNEEAARALSEVWALRKTYDVAASLAQAEIALKRYTDAAEHLDFCVSHFSPAEAERTLEQMKTALSEVKTHVATLTIAVDHDGAKVLADGRTVGVTPLPAPTFLEPGAHTLEASLSGDKVSQVLNVQAGAEYRLTLNLGGTNPSEPRAAAPDYAPAIVTGGISAATLIGGVVLLLEASHKGTQRDEHLAQLPGTNPCAAQSPTANAMTCNTVSSLDGDARLFRTLSFVGFGTAVAAGVATYFLWPSTAASDGLAFRAMVLPSRAGLDVLTGLQGNF